MRHGSLRFHHGHLHFFSATITFVRLQELPRRCADSAGPHTLSSIGPLLLRILNSCREKICTIVATFALGTALGDLT